METLEYEDFDYYIPANLTLPVQGETAGGGTGTDDKVVVSLGAKAMLGIVYVAMIAVCAVADTLMVIVVIRQAKMRTVMNLLLTSLAISDILVAVLSAPLFMDFYLREDWRYSLLLCRMAGFVKNCSMHVSTNTLVIIAIYRCAVVTSPRRFGTSHPSPAGTCTWIAILVTWAYSALLAVPTVLYTILADVQTVVVCIEQFPIDAKYSMDHHDVTSLVLGYIVPVLTMIVCYGGIACMLNRKASRHAKTRRTSLPMEDSSQGRGAGGGVGMGRKKSRWRVYRMLMAVFIAFIVCWTPYYAFLVYRRFFRQRWKANNHRVAWSYFVDALAMANSACNALINILMNENVSSCAWQILSQSRCARTMLQVVRTVWTGRSSCPPWLTSRTSRNKHPPGDAEESEMSS